MSSQGQIKAKPWIFEAKAIKKSGLEAPRTNAGIEQFAAMKDSVNVFIFSATLYKQTKRITLDGA